jgi:biotin carboxyl carrier protein
MVVAGQRVEAHFRPADADTRWDVRTATRTWWAGAVAGLEVRLFDAVTDADESVRAEDELSVLFLDGEAYPYGPLRHEATAGGSGASDGALRAPMPGKIVAAPLKAGDTVAKGQPVVVLEAMKMEHALVAPFDGVVGEVSVSVGDQVAADTVLATVEAAS